ncbi:Acetyltransferase (isoleucine patch superfamily) [Pseudomonas sp. NFACC02]|uniref:CatB-related O-acetyltransferase n=1 Tax=Pseudomonas sp. NFACC02 TaxID=1566250 RepID=UPI0008C66CB2|nr:CatB-related O-acetyltransferase [Pseudomonas sp. NFACC02]SEQ41721.1 Acetyltransferase (isoleucine patch superfamily) [Pseudomonas sp. NFACC02]
MNFLRRRLLDRQLKRALSRNECRLDSGIRGLRKDMELTLEYGVKLHQIKIDARQLSIGAYTDIVSGSELHNVAGIGRYCSIARNVTIGQHRKSHPLDWLSSHSGLVGLRQHQSPATCVHEEIRQTMIGHDVWIGMDVLILEGITIGTGAVIGAQSLITKDVPPYAIVTGSPGKVQRYRFNQDIIDGLLASQWWNLTPRQLAELPIEDPAALLETLKGVVVPDSHPGKVVVRNHPFAVDYHAAQ